MTIKYYDAVVVGAGPAGAMAAAMLGNAGADVLCLHKNSVEPCAGGLETLKPDTFAAFRKNLLDPCPALEPRRVEATISTWGHPSPKAFAGFENPHGGSIILDRSELHVALLDGLKAQKVETLAATVFGVEMGPAGWNIYAENGSQLIVGARYLIDASGRKSKIPSQLGLKKRVFDKMISHCFTMPKSEEDRSLRVDALPNGWLFTVCDGQRRLISFHTDGNLIDRRSDPIGTILLRDGLILAASVSEVVSNSDIDRIDHNYIRPAFSSTLERAAGANFFICGDAASTADPLSSNGIAEAVISSTKAVETIIENGDPQAWKSFETDRRTRFKKHLNVRSSFYRSENRWPFAPFWARRQANQDAYDAMHAPNKN